MKIKPAFTIEWEYGPNKPCRELRVGFWRRAVFGFLIDASGNVVQSILWWKGKLS